MDEEYEEYPVFKGLQKPIELMGIRGKFLIYAIGSIAAGFVAFLAGSIIASNLIGILAMLVVAGFGIALIYIKQKEGLHSKKRYKGIAIYKGLFKN